MIPTRHLRLDRDAVVAAWRHLGLGDRPPLLEVADHGATLSDRDAADHAALCGLRTRGLARTGADGTPVPVADLADALRVLDRPEVDVDLRCWETAGRSRYAAVGGELTVLAELDGGSAWTLEVGQRPAGAEPGALVAALALQVLTRIPEVRALPGGAMTVPAAVLFADGPTHRLAPAVGNRVTALRSEPPRRRMQLGAWVRAGSARRRIAPLTVVDTAAGRMVVELDADLVRVRPADRSTIARELGRRARAGAG